jgi:hypothetical protein
MYSWDLGWWMIDFYRGAAEARRREGELKITNAKLKLGKDVVDAVVDIFSLGWRVGWPRCARDSFFEGRLFLQLKLGVNEKRWASG